MPPRGVADPAADPAAAADGPARSADRGAVLLLTIGYALLVLTLVIVVVDVSAFFLSRRALAALADGAALAGTSAEDGRRLYGAGPAADLALDPAGVSPAVNAYLAGRDAGTAYPNLQLREVRTDGRTVTVVLSEDKPLPFLTTIHTLTGAFPGGTAGIEVAASARAPVRP